jgi:hypothetical protein
MSNPKWYTVRGAKRPDHRFRLSAEQLEDRTLLTAPISLGFAGMSIKDSSGCAPPDTIAAAGLSLGISRLLGAVCGRL